MNKTYTAKNGGTYGLIDLVIVILDGSSRDMGTVVDLLEKVILKNITASRMIVTINQADIAIKKRHWNKDLHVPEQKLYDFKRTVFICKKG